jgi:ornithine cyclodeaminase
MRVVAAEEIDRVLAFPDLVEALGEAFRAGFQAPRRHHHEVSRAGATTATQLLMPAWTDAAPGPGSFLGVKIVSVFPDNGALGLPAIQGVYLLQDGRTGEPLALMDGKRLTVWRTACASALAARALARSDASRLLLVGAGALAPFLARAHASVRPIRSVAVWNRSTEAARRLAQALSNEFETSVVENLEAAVPRADVVSCATLSRVPLVQGAWLEPGQHLDLVGAFNLSMREADDEALARARVFIDTPGALSEGGDVAVAIKAGTFSADRVEGDLAAIARGQAGRRDAGEITLFKSIGASVEDLAAAILTYRRLSAA